MEKDTGDEYTAVSLHTHPKRAELEAKERQAQANAEFFEPLAGPYDITLIKLDRWVNFKRNRIAPICLFAALETPPAVWRKIIETNVKSKPFSFQHGYVAGFGSSSFSGKCWTIKQGPNPFMECAEDFIANGEQVKVLKLLNINFSGVL